MRFFIIVLQMFFESVKNDSKWNNLKAVKNGKPTSGELDNKVKEFYKLFFGVDLSDVQIKQILLLNEK